MTILLDTSGVVDNLRGHPAARQTFSNAVVRGERVVCSQLTKVEVLAGMRVNEEWETRRLLNSIEWIDVDSSIAELAGLMANRYLRSYPGIDALDFIIAATAEHLRATLWTRNVKHFPMFANLTRPY